MKQTKYTALLLLPIAGLMAVVILLPDKNDARPIENASQDVITLKGAVQFGEDHAFTRTVRKFEELVKKYYGKRIEFDLYKNSELGLEKDYFGYMSLGYAVDYGIVSPAHMSTFSEAAPLMDMPFLFRDLDHWNKVLESDALQPIADEVSEKADVNVNRVCGRRRPQSDRQQTGKEHRGVERAEHARDGRAYPDSHLPSHRGVAIRDCLQRSLQCHSNRCH